MCFAIPLKVSSINGQIASMEDGRRVRLGDVPQVNRGDYLEVYADLAVNKLTKSEALKIRKLIKKSK